MRLQVLSQGFGERPTALIAQGQQARVAQHQQRAQRGTVCLHHAKARFTHPFVSREGLLDQRQGHALLFEFDDAVQPAQQFKAPVCADQRRIGGLLDMAGRQIRRADAQRTLRILTQFYAVEGLPALPALTPGDAAGFRAAENFRRPLAEALLQALCGVGRQCTTGREHPAHGRKTVPVEIVAHAFEQRGAGDPGE